MTWTLLALAGCGAEGPPRVAVEGVVTFRGQSLEKGSILFVPIEGASGPEAGAAVRGGRYRLPAERGPAPGKLRVEIRAESDLGYDLSEPSETVPHIGEPFPSNRIPAKYNDRSVLIVEATVEGPNRFDFPLPLAK